MDLFCGIGGFSYGFEKAGYDIKLAIDNNSKLQETFNKNHERSVFKQFNLSEDNVDEFDNLKIDLIIGSPPCQGFSDARGCRIAKNKKGKLRNSLSFVFLKVVNLLQPQIALLENVKGFSTYKINEKLMLNKILEEFKKINYNVSYKILNTVNFGIPQNRERIFILAIHKELNHRVKLPEYGINQDPDLNKKYVSLKEALCDLPLELKPEIEQPTYTLEYENATNYQKSMRKKGYNEIFNHEIVSYLNKFERELIRNMLQGKVYRSSRFGKNYIGVWDLFKDNLKQDERELLHFLCKKRTQNEFKELKKKYQEGYIRLEKFPINPKGRFVWKDNSNKDEKNNNRTPKEIIDNLLKKGWLRKRKFKEDNNEYFAYDINTKSGIMSKYKRLSYIEPCSTIQTVSFKVRELIHPIANRPLTLREGARIQSFPDDFRFYGSKSNIATMIGNAVPPLMAYHLGLYIKFLLDYITGRKKYRAGAPYRAETQI